MIGEIQLVPGVGEVGMTEAPKRPEPDPPETAEVKRWLARIAFSKKKFKPDFDRMRRNMAFVTGKQWCGQKELDDDRYTCNLTLRQVNQKVATLYAKNPTAVAVRRDRLDYQIWDEDVDSLIEAVSEAAQLQMAGLPLPVHLAALFADYSHGREVRKLVDQVCKTLNILYQYFVDRQKPEFKEQAKQLVRRVIICGVGYARPILCIDADERYKKFSSVTVGSTVRERLGRAKEIMSRLEQGELDYTAAEVQTLKSLILSIGASGQGGDEANLPERLEFDFPPATAIIVDERCRNLKEFVAARWIAQEYILPVNEVNALFDVDIKTGTGEDEAMEFDVKGDSMPARSTSNGDTTDPYSRKIVKLYDVFDYSTKTHFFLVEGYNRFVTQPEPLFPSVSGFWHHFALTFNDVEPDDETEASIYPPSDVQLNKHPQMEWNRTRNGLRDQRNANAPKYLVRKGFLTDEDKQKLRNAMPNEVIELEGVPLDQPLENFIQVMQVAEIDSKVYDTAPLEQDMLLGGGMQQANMGPAQPNVTATVGAIAEESRMTASSSNVDDLDGLLSRVAQAGYEMMLRGMSVESVRRVVGPGTAWPSLPESRENYINEINISVLAASSGRPNKAVDIANFREMAQIMLSAGANPVGIVEEASRRLDDNLDVTKFFPIVPTGLASGSASSNAMGQPQEEEQTDVGPSEAGLLTSPSLSPAAETSYNAS